VILDKITVDRKGIRTLEHDIINAGLGLLYQERIVYDILGKFSLHSPSPRSLIVGQILKGLNFWIFITGIRKNTSHAVG
jgi:hypothetical protein